MHMQGKFISSLLGHLKKRSQTTTTSIPEIANPAPWLAPGQDDQLFPVENDPTYQYSSFELPLPSPALRATVSDPELGMWLYIGSAWASVCQRYLPDDTDAFVLDIGCGVGKTARFLYFNPHVSYCGFDIFAPAIQWCRQAFEPLAGNRFRFEHFDGVSAMYNPKGKIHSAEYIFPVNDNSVDVVLAASVFTHLYEPDMRHYLEETFRVLKDHGVAIISFYFFEMIPYYYPEETVAPDKKLYGNEQMMFIRKEYLYQLAGLYGLKVREDLGLLCGQATIVFSKDIPTER